MGACPEVLDELDRARRPVERANRRQSVVVIVVVANQDPERRLHRVPKRREDPHDVLAFVVDRDQDVDLRLDHERDYMIRGSGSGTMNCPGIPSPAASDELVGDVPREEQRVFGLILEQNALLEHRNDGAGHVLADLVGALDLEHAVDDPVVEARRS